ncbi:DNA polymerase III subunit alpha, partial [Priestia megaterium]|nr:DNA polymerase III subunit alpha [Priestia megaterium]
IENILSSIQRKTGTKIDIKQIPLDDEAVYSLLGRGDTTGIFQLESEGMRSVLTRLKPTRFEDIVAVNALYRPGPMENIPLFIDRKHGRKPIIYPHPDLKPILENTYGVIVYQEQIMKIAAKLAGFSLGEADLLRRAVSKKQKEVLDRERVHFVGGAVNKGYNE